MSTYEPAPGPDWWSRLMSIGGLLVAGAALWYARIELPKLVPAEKTPAVAAEVDQLADRLQTHIEQSSTQAEEVESMLGRMETLHQDVTRLASTIEDEMTKLAEARSRGADDIVPANADLAEDDDLSPKELMAPPAGSAEPSDTFDALLSEERRPGNGEEEPAAFGSPENTAETSPAEMEPIEQALAAADLSVVHTTMRPLAGDEQSRITLRINNSGDEAAVIDRLSFQPQQIIEGIPTKAALEPIGGDDSGQLTCIFEKVDNMSAERGAQGRYVRRLGKPFTVQPGDEVEVVIAIADRDHLGFGLRGTLMIEFNDNRTLKAENAGVVFVGG